MTILLSYPESDKLNPGYVARLVQTVMEYPSHRWTMLTDPHTGIAATCKYLPTVADFVAIIEPQKFIADPESHPGPNFTGTAETEHPCNLSLDERKAFVITELGYDPVKKRKAEWCFKPRSLDELAALPPAMPSAELKADHDEHTRLVQEAAELERLSRL